jgi:hypothetical protein
MIEVKPGQVWHHKRDNKNALILILCASKKEKDVYDVLYLASLKFFDWHARTIIDYFELVK